MLFTALTAAIETAFNAWLKLDGDALPRLHKLHGKVIEFHITGLDIHLFFMPTDDPVNAVTIMTDFEGDADVTIRGAALALARLSRAEDSGKATLEGGIEIDGDMRTGEAFSRILRDVDIDWEELLSQAVGDIVAHQAGQFTRETKGWLDDTAQAMRMNTTEYLQEESRVLPADAEVAAYLDAVDTLRMDADRLDARVQRLQQQLDQTDNQSDSQSDNTDTDAEDGRRA